MALTKIKIAAAIALVLLVAGGTVKYRAGGRRFVQAPPAGPSATLDVVSGGVWSDGSGRETFIAAFSSATGSVTFPDGSRIEVVAMRDADAPDRWWDANGRVVGRPASMGPGEQIPLGREPGMRQIDFLLRVVDNSPKHDGSMIIPGSPVRGASVRMGRGTSSWSVQGTPMTLLAVGLPREAKSADLMLSLASGPWRDAERHELSSNTAPTTGPNNRIRILSVSEENGKTLVEVRWRLAGMTGRQQDQILLIAGDKELGNVVRAGKNGGMAYVFNCPRAQAKALVWRVRPYEVGEMTGLPLLPR